MFNKKEIKSLKEIGFEKYIFGEEEVYCTNDWTISKNKNYVEEILQRFEDGFRVCLMNYDDIKNVNVRSFSFVLENSCDGGIWICSSVEEIIEILENEE